MILGHTGLKMCLSGSFFATNSMVTSIFAQLLKNRGFLVAFDFFDAFAFFPRNCLQTIPLVCEGMV